MSRANGHATALEGRETNLRIRRDHFGQRLVVRETSYCNLIRGGNLGVFLVLD